MEKREQLYEGKAKKVFATDDADLVIVDYKDDATAGDGAKKGTIRGKGVVNNRLSNNLMKMLAEKGVPDGAVMIDNGSGLSRTSRVTARAMTQILAAGWLSPRMTEYAASLPVSGVDGTMRKRLEATGRTHLKTGYLQDVRSIGGYVYAKNGRRYALYASVHGERNMAGGIRFLDKVVECTYLQK